MTTAYIVDAVRTAGGRRGGRLAGVHPVDLLAKSLDAVVERSGVGHLGRGLTGRTAAPPRALGGWAARPECVVPPGAWRAGGRRPGLRAVGTAKAACSTSRQAAPPSVLGVRVRACGVHGLLNP